MLPLWIIDLNNQDDRQTHFRELVGRLYGVLMEEDIQVWQEKEEKDDRFWFYTRFDNIFGDTDWDDADVMSQHIYDFQESIVQKGQEFVHMLRKSNVDGAATLNICVLGDITQKLSQLVFPSIAVMLQKEKGRILPNHIHQGISIVGTYYIPSNVNSLDVKQRQNVYLSLREIEVQHAIPSVRGYDRMFFFQDVQNRIESYMPILNETQQAEYLFQCLVHLYYACDRIHPLISGSSSDDRFYFSMGCASVFFDSMVQDRIDNETVLNDVIGIIGKDGDLEYPDQESEIIDFSKVDVGNIISKFQHIDFDLSDFEMAAPQPHPIANFADKKLKKLYYNQYLRYYPINLRMRILDVISRESGAVLEEISSLRKQNQNVFAQVTLPSAIEKQLVTSNIHVGCLTRIVRNLKSFKTEIGKMKVRLYDRIEQHIWAHVLEQNVPKNLRDDFEAYHESYCSDIESKSHSRKCEEMKQTAQEDLINILKQETTFMGRLGRSFLMGILFVLTLMPFVTLVSQDLIDLGDVKENAVYWSMFIFIIPLIWQLISLGLYYRKKNKKECKLKAYYLHDAYARVANRIEAEANTLYDYMVALCDEYLKRCKWIDRDVRPCSDDKKYDGLELPVTLFNQPVVSGMFGGNTLIKNLEEEDREVYVQRVPRRINTLDDEDCHLLLHSYKDDIMLLFGDINVRDKHERVFDEQLGYKVFISQKKEEERMEKRWNECRSQFYTNIKNRISRDLLPQKNPTIGEKIVSYAVKMDDDNVLKPLVQAATTNGELTSSADIEHCDVKGNSLKLQYLFEKCKPTMNVQYQFDANNPFLSRYLFFTRWRTFDYVALNRILPSEDFDMEIRKTKVNQNELSFHKNATSSLILWAICQNDNSSEWLKLFDATRFQESMLLRDIYASKLNVKD